MDRIRRVEAKEVCRMDRIRRVEAKEGIEAEFSPIFLDGEKTNPELLFIAKDM